MGRIVGQKTGNHPVVVWLATGLGLASSLLLALGATAGGGEGDGDGPVLTPPSEMPVVSKPANPKVAPARPPAANRGGPAVLALPGLTTPSARPSPAPEPAGPVLDPGPGGPTLDAPIEMRRAPEATSSGLNDAPRRSSLPLVLESEPLDEPAPLGGTTPRTGPATRRPTPNPTPRPSTRPAPVQARRPRFFGLMPGPVPPDGPSPSPSRSPSAGRASADDIREDPAADSALKRRIEKQARDAVGDRARSIDVKVVGKDAVVQARGVKFLQKRAVRKSLEAIPALSGVRSTIEVVD